MAYLLDTHTFLWFVSGDSKLPLGVRNKIKDINKACYLSMASLWEITIKHQIGKLELHMPLKELFEYAVRNKIEFLDISPEHFLSLSNLPIIHTDPFDRLIISQAISENLIVLTQDKIFRKYKIKSQW